MAAAVCVVTVPAGIATADPGAQITINQLQLDGYTVNVDRVGSAPIQDCVVTSVRNPQIQTRTIRDYYGKKDANGNRKWRIIEIETGRSISVSLDCSR
ncbi:MULTISPECIES: hypothetical protein [unclassified Mycobacterium]|uniref:hypothetical protein n=1 Tax=unclassified Mycobacterium TaxID=2642494 RepID=UPI0029C64DAB|nr:MULTISPECIES: hypothetical protein [unclassified Mycobacterium]